ncbi:nucleotide-binding alpha-beta plait domain-containing protein [Tanacetum coccineum]
MEQSKFPITGTTSRDLWLSLEKAYAPHSTSREYTLKTQLLRIEMHGDETPDAYLNCAQEYADAHAAIGEPVKDKDLVMLAVSGLPEEYNGLKTTITARQSPITFSELHALLMGSPSMPKARQAQLSELTAQLSALRFQVSPIVPSRPQAFYGARPSNNNRNNNNNNRVNRNNSRDIGANSRVTPDLEEMDNSEAYYGDDTLHVGNGESSKLPLFESGFRSNNILDLVYCDVWGLAPLLSFEAPPIMDIVVLISLPTVFILLDMFVLMEHNFLFDIPITTSPTFRKTSPYYSRSHLMLIPTTGTSTVHLHQRSPISFISVSHLSPTSQTSTESSNGQPSPVLTTSIPTPPPPTPPPPPPPIIQQRLVNLRQNPKQQVPYNPFANHATVLPTTITELTSFTVANNSPEWRQAMKEEYDALMKNRMSSLVPHASNTNGVDGKWVYWIKRDKNGAITCYKARFVAKRVSATTRY